VAKAQAQWNNSTVINEDQFTPLTPENEKASESSTTEYDRGQSDTSEDERIGPSEMSGSSEYSPVSGVEPEQQKVKQEDLLLAQYVQRPTERQSVM
jgi:hypothetical protein